MGGRLGIDQQNLVTRQGLARAGSVAPGGGLGLGRDVVARDLGLASLGIEQQRLQNAANLGGAEAGLAQANQGNLFSIIQLLSGINNSQFGRSLAAGQYGESIRQPNVGLDPSAVANISVGNNNALSSAYTNQANMYGAQAQNYNKAAGQAIGFGLGQYSQPQTTAPAATPQFNFGFGAPTNTSLYGQPPKF
jgi:hypothetical protein